MQNKGLIRVLAIAFFLVCLFQLSFTLATRSVERHARKYAATQIESAGVKDYIAKAAAGNSDYEQTLRDSIYTSSETMYLDSMATEKVLYGYTYRQCQAREINLGLDLKGGMNVMVEVSTVDVVRALANHTDDSVFNAAIKKALANQKTTTNRDFVSLFYDAITDINPQVELAPYFNAQLRDRIKLGDKNDDVIKIVKEETDGAYDRT